MTADVSSAAEEAPLAAEKGLPPLDVRLHGVDVDGLPDVVTLVRRQCGRTPDRVALRSDSTQLTYAELLHRVESAAAGLGAHDIGVDDVVGLCAIRSVDLVVALLAIGFAGAAYLPLDTSYPETRLEHMIDDAKVRVVVSTGETWAQPAIRQLLRRHRVLLAEDLARADPAPLPGPPDDDRLAYVVYTSGSTGRPKGIAMGHGPITRLVAWHLAHDGLPSGAVTAQFAPVSFDVSVQEIFSTLGAGGILEIVPDAVRTNASRLLDLLRERRVHRLFLPTPALQLVATAGVRRPPLHDLRRVVCGGEQLIVTPAIRSWFAAMPHCALDNHYGPSEAHVVTTHTLTGEADRWPTLVPIGTPLPHVELRLVNEAGRAVADDEAGEVLVGGPCLARGYLGRPELTAERFFVHPSGSGRIYRTGDLARRDADGVLHYLGRNDTQVQIRGFRVEPAEVEAVLAAHQSVDEVAVVAVDEVIGSQRLEAHVVATDSTPDPSGLAQELLAIARRHLPAHMVPSDVTLHATLPRTPNGKIDRAALPRSQRRRHLASPLVLPATPTEAAVATAWREVLESEPIGVLDDLRLWGASSLHYAHVRTRLAADGVGDVPIDILLETPTIRVLAARIDGGDADATTAGSKPRRNRRVRR